jgi:hypothetical protein
MIRPGQGYPRTINTDRQQENYNQDSKFWRPIKSRDTRIYLFIFYGNTVVVLFQDIFCSFAGR